MMTLTTTLITMLTAASAALPGASTVVGNGGGELDMPGFEGDPVNFSVRGHTIEPGNPLSVQGSFEVTHDRPDGSPFAEFSGKLDCLLVGGDVAVATGVVDDYDIPGLPDADLDGRRVGFTIDDDGRHDRIGWSWAVAGFDQDVPMCTSTAPFFEIQRGQFSVRE